MAKLIDDEGTTGIVKAETPAAKLARAGQTLVTALAERLQAAPDYIEALRPLAGVGTEGIEESAVQLARIAIAQPLSVVVRDNLGPVYMELYNSMFSTTVWPVPGIHQLDRDELKAICDDFQKNPAFKGFNKDGMAEVVLPVLVLDCFRDRLYFKEGDLLCAARRGGLRTREGFTSPAWQEGDTWDKTMCDSCPLKDWPEEGAKEKSPPCTDQINAVCLLPTEPLDRRVAAVVFASSSHKVGRKLEGFVKSFGRQYPAWARMYGLWVEEQEFDQGKAGVLRVKDLGWASADLIAEATSIHNSLQTATVSVHQQDASSEEGPRSAPVGVEEDPFGDS